MSNVKQNVLNSASKPSIKDLFESMAYSEEKGSEDTTSVVAWLRDTQNFVLTSVVSGQPFERGAIALRTELENFPLDIKLLNSEEDIVGGVGKSLKTATKESLNPLAPQTQNENAKKIMLDLIRRQTNDLVLLEAFAGQIPTWVVRQADQPNWLANPENSLAPSLLESGPLGIFLQPTRVDYCMKDILSLILAVAQRDEHVVLLIALENVSDISLSLSILYLVDMMNNAGIRKNNPVDVLLLNRKCLLPTLFAKLSAEGLRTKVLVGCLAEEAVREIPNKDDNFLMEFPTAAAVNLANSYGKGLQHIIDSSADLLSAVNSIVRNTWLSGININHRTRSLLFVHQPVYSQVLDTLIDCLDQMKVKEFKSEIPTGCDFVKRTAKCPSAILSCIKELGAKTIPANSDFGVPTVIYDIGTSSDIVANKEKGLGCLLLVIPYRSLAELFSLFNNQEESDNVFIYANEINTTMDIIRNVKGKEISVNGAVVGATSKTRTSWASFGTSTSPIQEQAGDFRSSNLNLTLSANGSKEWGKLSNRNKMSTLQQLLLSLDVHHSFISELHFHHMDLVGQSTVRVRPEGVSGLVLVNPDKIPVSEIVQAITVCILSERPVIVFSVSSKLSEGIGEALKSFLPPGLITLVHLKTYGEVVATAKNLDLLWVINGSDASVPLLRLPKSVSIKTVLINSANDGQLLQTAEIVMSSTVRNCYL